MKWIALFSQTGSEIRDISKAIGIYPEVVITDNINNRPPIVKGVCGTRKTIYVNYKGMNKSQRIDFFKKNLKGFDMITLNGWLNIVPSEICEEFEIYNGHPGLITKYPELKGKDPQARFARDMKNYPSYGSVVHKVTSEVDGGEVVSFCEQNNNMTPETDYFARFKATSLQAWFAFFENYTTLKS